MSGRLIKERIKEIQRRLGVRPDGILGPVTLSRIEALLDQVYGQQKPQPMATALTVSKKGLDKIVQFEISSERYYKKHCATPTWPGGESGVTIGIGYDLGYNSKAQIEKDWKGHISDHHLNQLLLVAGIKGDEAQAVLPSVKHIVIPLEAAKAVFYTATLPRYAALTRKAFPGVEELPPDAQAMLLSLVFNRGARMSGARRREMRAIRSLVPAGDLEGIAAQLRSMKRLWDESRLPGLHRRREEEARMVADARSEYEQSELVKI